jgi:hypothetical protein
MSVQPLAVIETSEPFSIMMPAMRRSPCTVPAGLGTVAVPLEPMAVLLDCHTGCACTGESQRLVPRIDATTPALMALIDIIVPSRLNAGCKTSSTGDV